MNIDSSEEEPDSNVQEQRWKWRLPRFTTPAALSALRFNSHHLSQQQLIPQDTSGSTESLEHVFSNSSHHPPTPPSHQLHLTRNEKDVNDSTKSYDLRKRPRSVGDISESDSLCNAQLIIESTVQRHRSPTPTTNTAILDANPDAHTQGRESSPGDNRSNSPAPNSSSVSSTGGGFLSFLGQRFNKSGTRHLDRSSNAQSNSGDLSGKHTNNRNSINDGRYTKFPVSSAILRPGNNNAASPVQNPALPRSNTVVCDSGLATVLAGSSTHKGAKPQLKPKSKSDHNLGSRVNAKVNTKCSDTKQKLNSVQLGDHATISLPWTPAQQRQNNLSSVTPTTRSIPNTHTNIDFSKSSVRYIDTDFWSHQTHHHWPPTPSGAGTHNLSRRATSNSNSKRRSRSLERTSHLRIIHASPAAGFNQSDPLRSQDPERNAHGRHQLGASSSLERQTHSKIRQNLNPSEESVLLRHIRSQPSRTNSEDSKHRQHIVLSSSKSNETKINSVHKSKPPSLKHLHTSSEPNSSFSSSCDSSTLPLDRDKGVSSSAPPSPPPRPLCTLKPNKSRPVVTSFSFSSADKPPPVDRALKRKVPSFMTRSTSAMNSISTNMTSLSRRPIPSPAFSEPITTNATLSDSVTTSVDESLNSAHSQQEEASGLTVIAGPTAPSTMSTVEDARNSGFINKPTKGWLHSDQLLTKEGVQYTVRYVGCLDVNTSMKSLDFDTRSLIAKECINQICEAAGLKSVDRKRRTDRRLIRLLGLRPRLDHAGSDVHLTITSTCIKLTSLETGAVVAVHEMPNISFASGGDSSMLDFVAYVAKDQVLGRACFVLECGSGLAQDVITTVGQAFELRFKEYLQKRPPIPITRHATDDPEYYNDLPGKVPPDSTAKAQDLHETKDKTTNKSKEPPKLTLPQGAGTEVSSVNLIDFEAPTPPAFGPTVHNKSHALETLLLDRNSPTLPDDKDKQATYGPVNDPFDMQPFEATLRTTEKLITTEELRKQLETEDWFHGMINRSDAEELVVRDGDFLVRESQNSPGQFVLTGIQGGSPKHLLLVDQNGVVRTKDKTFDSVAHLVRYHCENCCPIISAESMVLLRNPILKIKRGH